MAQKITDANYKELLAQDKLVVVDFWAEWCGPCRSIAPAVDELAAEFEGKAIIGKYNVDDDNALSSEMGIRNIPTFLQRWQTRRQASRRFIKSRLESKNRSKSVRLTDFF